MNKIDEHFGIKAIAAKANVSIATVDRAIHNRGGVAEKTKKKIQAIIQEFNYQPNILARRLASRKIIRLASLIPMVSEETNFWQAPYKGILEAEGVLNQYGVKIDKYFFDQNYKPSFTMNTDLILKERYDGILLAPSFIEESTLFIESCNKLNIPCVFINSDIPDKQSLCYIGPDLFQSGYLAGHLISLLVKKSDKILVLNISREMSNLHHVLRKEDGFRAYLRDRNKKNVIIKKDIRKTDYSSIKSILSEIIDASIKAIFVTNSRVSYVARYLEEAGVKVALTGYDFLEENIEYLKKETIDFLICQKPQEQAYKGVMVLYNTLVFRSEPERVQFMPIDIITKENYKCYKN